MLILFGDEQTTWFKDRPESAALLMALVYAVAEGSGAALTFAGAACCVRGPCYCLYRLACPARAYAADPGAVLFAGTAGHGHDPVPAGVFSGHSAPGSAN